MKKFMAIIMLAVVSTTAFVGCTSGEGTTEMATPAPESTVQKEPLKDLLAKMIEAGSVRMPMEADDTLATENYKIDLANVEEYAIAQTGISPGPGLVVMVKAKPGQVEAAKANIDALLEAQIGNAFYPNEKEAAEKAEVIVEGDYVALFIVNDEVKDVTMQLFKDSKAE